MPESPRPGHARIVAVALLTEPELRMLGQGFDRFYPVDETPCFDDLLAAIDEADRGLQAGCAQPVARPRQQ